MTILTENPDLYRIVGCAMRVRNTLGSGFLESVYEKALEYELVEAGFSVRLHVRIPVFYKGVNLNRDFIADVLVNDSIILELKAEKALIPVNERQLNSYLEFTGLSRGILFNFGNAHHLECRCICKRV